MFCFLLYALVAWPMILSASVLHADKPGTVKPDGFYGNLRYRFEYVEEDRFKKDSYANTLQIRGGYRHTFSSLLMGTVEGLALAPFGLATYNNTYNNVTDRPIIADPPALRVNQANIAIKPHKNLRFTAGRQFLRLHNQRFVGSKSGKQIDQVFDAAAAEAKWDKLSLNYAFAFGVERSLGNFSSEGRWSMLTHIASASYMPFNNVKLEPYLLDFQPDRHDDIASTTLGARASLKNLEWDTIFLTLTADFARQIPSKPILAAQNYLLAETTISHGKTELTFGYEHLGGDGRSAMQTPLGTVNLFDGWVTKFATIPVDGLADIYAGLSFGALPSLPGLPEGKFQLAWHKLGSTHGGKNYGHEWDAAWVQKLSESWSAKFRYASYHAKSFSTDTKKISLVVQCDF